MSGASPPPTLAPSRVMWVLDSVEKAICAFLLVGLVGLLFIQVIARYFFGQSISWAEEISRFGLLALVYISAAMGAQMGTHIRVSGHLRLLPHRGQVIVLLIADLIWFAFNCVVIWQSIRLISSMNARPMTSGALQINMQYVYAVIPFGFALQSIRLLQRWWRILTGQAIILPAEEG